MGIAQRTGGTPLKNGAMPYLSEKAGERLDLLSSGDLGGNRCLITLVFAQPQLETPFEYEDVSHRMVIDKAFNARPRHWLRGGIVENKNRATRGLL
jgi:hypothetical protein